MVSENKESHIVFEKIIGKEYHTKDMPTSHKMKKGTVLIYPTEAFLTPENSHNFVSMHYLMKTVKEVKFLIVLNSFEITDIAMKQVQQTMNKMFALIKGDGISE